MGISQEKASFTRSAAQDRVNQLARELDDIDDTQRSIRMVVERRNRPSNNNGLACMANLVGEASSGSSGVQAAIQAYFAKSQPARNEVIVLSDSDEAGGKCIDLVSSSTSKTADEVVDGNSDKEQRPTN